MAKTLLGEYDKDPAALQREFEYIAKNPSTSPAVVAASRALLELDIEERARKGAWNVVNGTDKAGGVEAVRAASEALDKVEAAGGKQPSQASGLIRKLTRLLVP